MMADKDVTMRLKFSLVNKRMLIKISNSINYQNRQIIHGTLKTGDGVLPGCLIAKQKWLAPTGDYH